MAHPRDLYPVYDNYGLEMGDVVAQVVSIDSWDGPPAPRHGLPVMEALQSLRRYRAVRGASTTLRHLRAGFQRRFRAGMRGVRRCLHGLALSTSPPSPAPTNRRLPALRRISFAFITEETYDCVACMSTINVADEEAVQVSCGHIYHPECLLQLVDVSMRSPAQYPPRCCRRPISASLFQPFFSAAQAEAFTAFQKERSTSRRVYCANPRCSLFLGAREKRTPVRIYTCPAPACGTSTCARCRAAVDTATAASPAGHVCTHDAGHRAALQLGSRLGWTRCPECEQLIERSAGCAHMTCACGTQFCYRCGAKWKSCSCVEWRGPEAPPAPPGRRQRDRGVRDLFAPLQTEGDLARQLALWRPPTPPVHLIPPPRRMPRPPLTPVVLIPVLAQGESPGPSPIEVSARSSMYTAVGEAESVEGHVGSCLPLRLDVQLVARGEMAQAARQHSLRRMVSV